MLLACLPCVAALVLYWLSCAELFGRVHEDVPRSWLPRLFLPVLTGTLTPLAISRAPHVTEDSLLLSASAIGVLFSLLVASSSSSFHDMQIALRVGDYRLPFAQRWRLVRAVGVLVIGYAGLASVLAVR